MPLLLSIVNWVMTGLFVVAATVQLNDPDPAVWIAMYLGAAAACVVFGRIDRAWVAAAGVFAVAAVWGGVLFSRVLGIIEPSDLLLKMNEKGGAVEVGREAGGLALVAVWMVVLLIAHRRTAR